MSWLYHVLLYRYGDSYADAIWWYAKDTKTYQNNEVRFVGYTHNCAIICQVDSLAMWSSSYNFDLSRHILNDFWYIRRKHKEWKPFKMYKRL